MLTVNLDRDVVKFLRGLPPKQERQLAERIQTLASFPRAPDVKLLRGYTDIYRADSGEYRVVFYIKQNTLYICLVGKRNDSDVYRKLLRKLR